MRKYLLLFVFLAALILSGCATAWRGYPQNPNNRENELQRIDPYYHQLIEQYYGPGDETSKRNLRDKFAHERLRVVDHYFQDFEQSLYRAGITSNVIVDWTTLSLNAAGAFIPHSLTKTILHALSGGIIGGKSSFDKNVFFERTMPALLSQMIARRKAVRVRIMNGMQLETDRYPLSQLMDDLDDYFRAGTIPGAIIDITNQAGVTVMQAEKDRRNFIESRFKKDKPGDILRKFWKPDGKNINEENAKRLKAWMKSNNIKTSITFFLRSALYTDARVKAVKDLKLLDKLRRFWKPDGKNVNEENAKRLKKWMKDNHIDTSITYFLRSALYADARAKAVKDLHLDENP